MYKPVAEIIRWLQGRFELLFATLVAALVLPPFVGEETLTPLLLTIFVSLSLIAGLLTVANHRATAVVGLVLVIPAILGNWWGRFTTDATVLSIAMVLSAVFFLYLCWLMFLHVMRASRVTTQILFGAICVYLLLGWGAAEVFAIMDAVRETSFSFEPAASATAYEALSQRLTLSVYFTFVTMTTLGYGDFAPVTEEARISAAMLAVTGQIYLVTAVARLVALHVTHGQTDRTGGD